MLVQEGLIAREEKGNIKAEQRIFVEDPLQPHAAKNNTAAACYRVDEVQKLFSCLGASLAAGEDICSAQVHPL